MVDPQKNMLDAQAQIGTSELLPLGCRLDDDRGCIRRKTSDLGRSVQSLDSSERIGENRESGLNAFPTFGIKFEF